MKNWTKILAVLAAIVSLLAVFSQAVEQKPLDALASAKMGATHSVIITEADLTSTNTTTYSQAITSAIPANCLFEPVALILDAPFGWTGTNAYNSTAVAITCGADTLVASTQLNENGTKVTCKWGDASKRIYVPVATNVIFTFTGTTNYALADLTKGQCTFYYRELEQRRR